MMTSSNGSIFRLTGHLGGEFTGSRCTIGVWEWIRSNFIPHFIMAVINYPELKLIHVYKRGPGNHNPTATKESTAQPCAYFNRYTCHYTDVIMRAMAPQITSLTIIYSTAYSGADQRKHQSSASLAFVRGIPPQRASNAENVPIWWRRHHVLWWPPMWDGPLHHNTYP